MPEKSHGFIEKLHPAVFITPAAAVTSMGGLDETWEGLLKGRTGIRPLDDADAATFGFHGPASWLASLSGHASGIMRLEQLLFLIKDELEPFLPMPPGTGLVLATTKGAVDELSGFISDSGPDPYTVPLQPWNLASFTAEMLDIKGPVSTVSAACASGTVAIIQAAMRIMSGEAETMLVLGLDVLSRFVLSGFASLQALSRTCCRPFDSARDGLVLGEGAGAVFLSARPDIAEGRGLSARLSGFGISCDAVHITAPARDGRGLVSAIETATQSGTRPVGAVNAHGTATVYNDAMEIEAFRQVWDEIPPFHSVKGSMGHCLGAAGVIEACVAVKSLEAGVIPPTAGLHEPADPAMNVSGEQELSLKAPSIVSCNSGFGGINAAILMETSDL